METSEAFLPELGVLHVILGVGFPAAWHDSVALEPCATVKSSGFVTKLGPTRKNNTCQILLGRTT